MPAETINIENRIKALNTVLTEKHDRLTVDKALRSANGDMPTALASLKGKLPDAALQKVALAHSLAIWSDDHVSIVKALSEHAEISNLRDVALLYNVEKLTTVVESNDLPENIAGATTDEKKRNFAISLQNKLFTAEPTAVLHRMVQDAEVPIADTNQRTGVVSFLTNQPDFNIRTTSVYTALKNPDAFKDIADEHRAGVVEQLKTLQRVQAISPVPAAVPVLMNNNLTSAFRVAEIPESTFLSAHGTALGEDVAKQVYTTAINANIRNEHAMMTMREAWRGPGLAIMGDQQPMEMRMAAMQKVADDNAVPLNLETLFGSIDYCECDDCLSVYSPAAYFVEILQYLRNNDLGPDPADPGKPSPGIRTNPKDISNTPLEKLFRRRPDLSCLELTCENTFTVLPYIDLVNEVMESFVVHISDYHKDVNDPKQATLEVFNVTDETTSELLAQPQHINYQAYCILKDAVYPFTLPYHQPIDAIRIYLKYFGTSRYELLDTFRTANETCDSVALTTEQQKQMKELHGMVLDRAVDAEFLGITQEEYIILTKEAFWPKAYFDLTLQKVHSDDEYRTKIGVRPVHEYYGYKTEADMLNIDETSQVGLTFVKKQFLPRTGILYIDLVELLKTRFINPAYPQGKALTILESIRFSYRFLQTLVDYSNTDPKIRFAKLIDYLNSQQTLVPQIEARLHPDPCHKQNTDCVQSTDFRNWVYCYFERIGKLIVLESGEGPHLPIEGQLFKDSPDSIGTLRKDGTVVDKHGVIIGSVTIDGEVIGRDGKPFGGGIELRIKTSNGVDIGFVDAEKSLLHGPKEELLNWLPARDTCDLEKVRLTHLDGSVLTVDEYDRMQRFIRLWHKLGWTIDETGQALVGSSALSAAPVPDGTAGGTLRPAGSCDFVGFDAFRDDCTGVESGVEGGCPITTGPEGDGNCRDIPPVPEDISVEFLHQLVAVFKLIDLTGLPLDKLLTFWSDIGTDGEKPLYASLFLTHNILGIDKIFKSDTNGNYLTQDGKISEHMPVLTAALKMKPDDVKKIMDFRKLSDALTLSNVSEIYRFSLLARILHVRIEDMSEIKELFGEPFKNAQATLALLQDWGKMEDAGFTFRQLDYLILGNVDPLRPLGPSLKTILQLAKTLYDGLNAIDRDHPDITTDHKDDATSDAVRTKAGLLFETSVVERIIGLLEGTTVYTTGAPTGLSISIPSSSTLSKKLKYNEQKTATPPTGSIQVTGILTDSEIVQAKSLSNHPNWPKAIDCVDKQAMNLFNDVLSGIFTDTVEAQKRLMMGDCSNPDNPQDAANTAPDKRFYFLQVFLPFLREQLSQRLIVDTSSSAAGMPTDVTKELLSDILTVGTPPVAAMKALEAIKTKPQGAPTGWQGYLISSADADFTFVAFGDTQPPPLTLDGLTIPFSVQQECPPNVWSSGAPSKLKSGKLYWLQVTDRSAEDLLWRTPTSPSTKIPTPALLPDYSHQGTKDVFIKLYKSALVVNGFNLSVDEVSYWQVHGADFADDSKNFDFNLISLGHWRRMQAYASLRDKLPTTGTSLLDLFTWAGKPDDATKLSGHIAAVTLWDKVYIERLIAPEHFDLNRPEAFLNEINLVKLQQALKVSDVVGTDIDRLFAWANPLSRFTVCHQIAEDIRATLRAHYDQEDWEQVIKPLNDQLREDQKQALISYLLVQPDLIDWGVVDADSLFEFFLIDVQMAACMQTSRIKQAISTVQLFVQRCMLGLETQYGVTSDALDRPRWDWMQKYRVWEANRKVFLYPENWIRSELRDDKSPFYKELESELLQKDINTQTVQDALKNYLFKVDEVANLKVVGLFLDEEGANLHVFARTRNAPYFYYYRYFKTDEMNWYSWEKVQVDIPSYDVEDENGQVTENGTYLIPLVWNKRPLLFFPQFSKQTLPDSTIGTKTVQEMGTDNAVQSPFEYWEIKMAWSELRNKKWTQKQVSTDAVYTFDPAKAGFLAGSVKDFIHHYNFIPRVITVPEPKIVIEIYFEITKEIGSFDFTGSQLFKNPDTKLSPFSSTQTDFHVYDDKSIHSFQAADAGSPPLMNTEPYFAIGNTAVVAHIDKATVNFSHPFVHELLGKLNTGNLDVLFDYYLNGVPDPDKGNAFGADSEAKYHELKRPYSLYNWEAIFHVPMLLVDRMLAAQQFDQALKMCHYVLNPYAKGKGINDDKRFWQFLPFKEIDAANVLEKLFLGLQPNTADTPNGQINEWRNNPFQPHVIARSRPSAYMKLVAMKYIEILIAYGDYYFRQNTLETIPLAIQCYVLASHVYGPRGQKIPKRGKTLPQTYNSLLDKWDAFGNAMVELELVFPFSNQTPLPMGASNGVVGLANVFGFASTLYFCIPDNPQLRALRDTIDDRLFKIRHCEDIDGVFRQLPLFEPPIDPALLVQAAAQGLSLSSVLNDLNSPMPNYRFYYLLQKALELCSEVKALGNAFLSVKEKGDAEALSQLRAGHESSIQNLVMEVKKHQLDEAGKSLEALEQSRKGPVYRLQHYLKLVGEDLGKVPDENTDFGELPDQIEQPVDDSGLKLIGYEKEEMDSATSALDWQIASSAVEALSAILHLVPTTTASVMPLGLGLQEHYGGTNLGHATTATSKVLQIASSLYSHQSSQASRKAGFLRQMQDRVQQANIAGYEIKNIDKQILSQQIRISIAEQEITNQQKQIDNAQEVEEFLRSKYTNQDLYAWMDSKIKKLYHQAYSLAYDLAMRAEKVFRFERGLPSNFIQYGYWDAAYDGLFSGEQLYIGLKQLEAAYMEKRGHDFEITKSISLRQINPLALIQLKETGICEFALPEVLFDMDYPGHYLRRIKAVSLRIPCTIGPHTSLNCTLRLIEHKFRTSAIVAGKGDYPEHTDETDDRFSTVNVPISSIAVSSLEDENGVFELNFHDERYLPFEGAGVISKWRIELPDPNKGLCQFDYDTIMDVVIRMRFTTVDGGDKLKAAAADTVQAYIKSVEDLSKEEGLFAVFDLKNDFPNEWYSANHPPAGATERVLTIEKLNEKLPVFTKGRQAKNIPAADIYLYVSGSLPLASIAATQGGIDIPFSTGQTVGTMKTLVAREINAAMDGLQIKIQDTTTEIDKMWLLERYVLT